MIGFVEVVAVEPRPTRARLTTLRMRLLGAARSIGRRSCTERDELRALADEVHSWVITERKANV